MTDKEGFKMNNTLQDVVSKLESLFSKFNKRYFNNELVQPIITVAPDTTKGAYGWCTSWKAWKDKSEDESEGYYEINMCAEYLARPFLEICCTLIHEMVHLLNLQNEVQDTSRSGKYHNKRYKETAEHTGALLVEKDSKYGWCDTKLTDEAAAWIVSCCNDEKEFNIYRSKIPKITSVSKSSSRKYVCPECELIVRATKEVRIICAECDVELEPEL